MNESKKHRNGHHPEGGHSKWKHEDIQLAVRAVLINKTSKKKASKMYNIPRSTLQRYIKNCEIDGAVEKKETGRPTILSKSQEDELCRILIDMEQRLYGLSPLAVRKIVYQYCTENKIAHRFSDERQMAGKKWMKKFLHRHPKLSIRKPEALSIQRALGYNSGKVRIFEEVLKKELFNADGSRRIIPENIYNVDETGVSVNHKPQKILALKGKKSVSVITSAEKGRTVTAVCCMSAAGVYCPPFFIFPRKRFKSELLDRGPVGSVGAANPSGWINEQLFSLWFDHFLNFYQPASRTCPSILIMDGHASHTNNLQLVNKARANNVIILVLPSHCTHKIQPLDVAVFKSLKTHYDHAVDCWLHRHPGRAVQETNVAELFAQAWGKSATVANAISGFKKSRINPFVETNAVEEEFIGADVTNRPECDTLVDSQAGNNSMGVAASAPSPSDPLMEVFETEMVLCCSASDNPADSAVSIPVLDLQIDEVVETVTTSCSPTENMQDAHEILSTADNLVVNSPVVPQIAEAAVCVSSPSLNGSFSQLITVPKYERLHCSTKRAVAHAKVLTSSPYNRKLEDAFKEKTRKINKAFIKEQMATSCLSKKGKKSAKSKQSREKSKTSTSKDAKKNSVPCTRCHYRYGATDDPKQSDDWMKCMTCNNWYHISCAEDSGLIDDDENFFCVTCL